MSLKGTSSLVSLSFFILFTFNPPFSAFHIIQVELWIVFLLYFQVCVSFQALSILVIP